MHEQANGAKVGFCETFSSERQRPMGFYYGTLQTQIGLNEPNNLEHF